jgi:hypothetical protein
MRPEDAGNRIVFVIVFVQSRLSASFDPADKLDPTGVVV